MVSASRKILLNLCVSEPKLNVPPCCGIISEVTFCNTVKSKSLLTIVSPESSPDSIFEKFSKQNLPYFFLLIMVSVKLAYADREENITLKDDASFLFEMIVESGQIGEFLYKNKTSKEELIKLFNQEICFESN